MDRRIGLWLIGALLVGGCEDIPAKPTCESIADGGCPKEYGGTCSDPACSAVFRCEQQGWVLVQTCEAREDAGAWDAAVDAPQEAEPVCGDAAAPDSATGCAPGLEGSDCPVEAAIGCPATACLTGCDDFYACTASGWNLAAYCDEQLELVWVDDPQE